jgi:hypothetical protein
MACPEVTPAGYASHRVSLVEGKPRALLGRNGDRETPPALAATVADHLAARSRLHAGAEAVGAQAAFSVRLVGTFHDNFSRDSNIPAAERKHAAMMLSS